MKKLAVILFLLTASMASAAPHDFIVLMDTSQYMFDEYDTVIQSYFPEVVKDHLKLHDIFHLISFSDHPELELTQKIENRQDMEAILRRLLLLQPLGKYDDPLLALRFVYQYASGLPSYQEKTIVVFTPGLYNAPTQDHASPEAAKKEIANVISEIRNRGWNLRFVLVPTSTPSSQEKGSAQGKGSSTTSQKTTALSLDLAKTAQEENVPAYVFQPKPGFSNETLGIPRLTFPSNLGKINKDFSLSFKADNPADSAVILHLKAVTCNGISLLNQDLSVNLAAHETKTVSVPLSFSQAPASGAQVGKFHLTFDDGLRAYPNEASIRFEYMPGLEIWFLPFGIVLGIGLLGALIFALFQLVRKGYERGKHLANQHVDEKVRKATENDNPPREDDLRVATPVKATPLVKTTSSVIIPAESKKEEPKPSEKVIEPPIVEQPLVQPAARILVKPPKEPLVQQTSPNLAQQTDPSLDQFRSAAEAREQARKEEQAALLTTLTSSSQKAENSYAAFLKQTSSKQPVRSPEVQSEKATREPSPVATAMPSSTVTSSTATPRPAALVFEVKEGPSKEFAMLIWTSDFLFQNTRQPANWFRFRPGERKSVGNSKAHFKIVLVPVSETIAEVSYDGQELLFHPLAREYFPELPDSTACLNTDIAVHIQGEKVLFLRFITKTSKTEEVNKFLRGDSPALEDTLR